MFDQHSKAIDSVVKKSIKLLEPEAECESPDKSTSTEKANFIFEFMTEIKALQ